MEYGRQPVHTVVLACEGKSVSLGHVDPSENETYVLHGCCYIRIFEKDFDIRKERCNFAYRHGFELVLFCHLKFTHFLAVTQEAMSFFTAPSPEISTCES